jgi:N-acetylglucosamine-6-sulfatase
MGPRSQLQRVLVTISVLTMAFLLAGCGPIMAQDDRPNIVLILTDDLDNEAARYMPRVKSLLMDRGTTFENAFVTNSVCCPARATTLRGQYAHNHQILGNEPPLGGFEKFRSLGHEGSTVATWLQNAGYRTLLLGKYMNGYDTTYVPPGWDEWHGIAGNYLSHRLNEDGRIREYDPERHHLDDVLADKAVGYVRESAGGEPFFMWIGTKAPHLPATPAPRHEDAFADTPLPRPPSFDEKDVSDKPGWIRNNPRLEPWRIQDMQDIQGKRLRSMLAVDEMVGRLVDTLRRKGELKNTYIFFTSDNGFHLGTHRLTTGKWTPYEEDIRVPLVVRGPGVPRREERSHLVLNNDLAPTFADLAGVEPPSFVDGRSLMPLLREKPFEGDWRKAFLIEAPTEPDRSPLPSPSSDENSIIPLVTGDPLPEGWRQASPAELREEWGRPGFEAVRTEDHVYIEYGTGEREFYDLRRDPYQLNNRYATADPGLVQRMQERLEALRNCAGKSCRAAENEGR